ncbi:hypothetical protein [Vibrio rumoiensis]|uniref:Uncharacterized protein n=1 Tax=Vibrio rumoiensis TaxID=76258 RepID=A0ABW7J286_9VIBR
MASYFWAHGTDIDWLANAIAASYHMRPQQWLTKYGAGLSCPDLPKEHKHLLNDYQETQREMIGALKR